MYNIFRIIPNIYKPRFKSKAIYKRGSIYYKKINSKYTIRLHILDQRLIMRLPSNDTLYKVLIFLLTLMVILGILFDTDYN